MNTILGSILGVILGGIIGYLFFSFVHWTFTFESLSEPARVVIGIVIIWSGVLGSFIGGGKL